MNMNDDIQKKIEYLRRKMMQIAEKKGLADTESVKISQELDLALNDYEKLKEQVDNQKM